MLEQIDIVLVRIYTVLISVLSSVLTMTVTIIAGHDVHILLGAGICCSQVVFPAVTAKQPSQTKSLNSNPRIDLRGNAGKPDWHPLSQLSTKEKQWQLQADHLEECADEQQRQQLLYMREACAKRHMFQCNVWPDDDHISVRQQLLLTSLYHRRQSVKPSAG